VLGAEDGVEGRRRPAPHPNDWVSATRSNTLNTMKPEKGERLPDITLLLATGSKNHAGLMYTHSCDLTAT
jgi:hypothetical protein